MTTVPTKAACAEVNRLRIPPTSFHHHATPQQIRPTGFQQLDGTVTQLSRTQELKHLTSLAVHIGVPAPAAIRRPVPPADERATVPHRTPRRLHHSSHPPPRSGRRTLLPLHRSLRGHDAAARGRCRRRWSALGAATTGEQASRCGAGAPGPTGIFF